MSSTYDINVVRGDTWNGISFEISSQYTIQSALFRVKAKTTDTTHLLELSSAPAGGITVSGNTVVIDPVIIDIASGRCYYYLKLVMTNGFEKTWVTGQFNIDNGDVEGN